MIQEIVAMGFSHVELSHGIRITLVPGILKAVEEGLIQVSSCHNFCPLPAGIMHPAPNLYEPSSNDSREREQWVRATKRSIDFAAQVKARVLVCHLGSVRFFWFNPARKLKAYQRAHPMDSYAEDKAYAAVKESALARLRKCMPQYWAEVTRSILAVADYAKEKGITLGFENRERFDELPLDADFGSLLSGLPEGTPAGYWHDTGHAHLKERMGVLEHRPHLEANAPRLLGFHLHDVSAHGQDHQAVGSGRIDFSMISEFWRPYHLLVLELSPRLAPDQVADSKRRIERLLVSRKLWAESLR